MSLEIIGYMHRKHEEQTVGSDFKKRDFVIETAEQYAQIIKFELHKDKCNLIDNIDLGTRVKVSFNLKGREWQKDASSDIQVFNSLVAWRVEVVNKNTTQQAPQSTSSQTTPLQTDSTNTPQTNQQQGGDEDLPF